MTRRVYKLNDNNNVPCQRAIASQAKSLNKLEVFRLPLTYPGKTHSLHKICSYSSHIKCQVSSDHADRDAVDCRTTSCGSTTIGSGSCPLINASSIVIAICPQVDNSWLMVVSGGWNSWDWGKSS